MRIANKKRKRQEFERLILPHMGASYNLAVYLMGNQEDAEEMVQESFLSAFRAFDRFEKNNSAAWVLTIVRNRCFNALNKRKRSAKVVSFDEEIHTDALASDARVYLLPDIAAERHESTVRIRCLIARLPEKYREVVVLREIEGLSYREIAAITDTPEGTVMSRLSRGRRRLKEFMLNDKPERSGAG